jgi:hypothetical protein
VEAAIRDALAGKPFRSLLDLGTGTGRILECFGPASDAGSASTCRSDMLLSRAPASTRRALRHCSVRQGDIYDLPVPGQLVRRRGSPPGAALPRRWRPRASARRRACWRRPAACWWSTFAPHDS